MLTLEVLYNPFHGINFSFNASTSANCRKKQYKKNKQNIFSKIVNIFRKPSFTRNYVKM